MTLTHEDKVKQGKKNKRKGGEFERAVRAHMELQGWHMCKFQNNVDLENNKMIPAKMKFNIFARIMTTGTGFPDFIAFRLDPTYDSDCYEIIGVESKSNGYLDKEEKAKCDWYLDNKIFSRIMIAFKNKEGQIEYKEYERTTKE